MKLIIRLINKKNITFIISLFTILLIIWSILYVIPDIFSLLFKTIIGNFILFIITILILIFNLKYGIIFSIFSIINIVIFKYGKFLLYKKTNNPIRNNKEGFIWNNSSTQDFLLLQNTINPKIIFDVNLIQKSQASQEELDYFNKYQKWPWSDKTKELYLEAVKRNPFIRISPESSLNYSRTIYNESAILMLLSYQTKEGLFLLNGILVSDPSGNKMEELPSGFGDYPYFTGELENRTDNIIKCNMTNPKNATLEKITFTGKGGIYGEQTSISTPINYNELENLIPGFSFINKPCNPCGAINESPDYSCPFKLILKNKPPFISKDRKSVV